MTIHVGKSEEIVRTLPRNHYDAVVTDPPYEIGFMGRDWDRTNIAFSRRFWSDVRETMKPGAYLLAFGGTRSWHRLAIAIEDAGFALRDTITWLYGSGFPKSHNLKDDWSGWGTALKPAWEPIIVARKPFTGSVADNVLTHGTGALNIDGCRIDASEDDPNTRPNKAAHHRGESRGYSGGYLPHNSLNPHESGGRWPANVILDEEAAAMLDAQTGTSKSGTAIQRNGGGQRIGGNGIYAGSKGLTREDAGYGDTGGASRFFYVAKASRRERNAGLEGMPEGERPLALSNWKGQTNGSGETMGPSAPQSNIHPTVKPVALMQYLVRLVTQPGGIILDPFFGSGTTGVAAEREGMACDGIDRDPEYATIARARIAHEEK